MGAGGAVATAALLALVACDGGSGAAANGSTGGAPDAAPTVPASAPGAASGDADAAGGTGTPGETASPGDGAPPTAPAEPAPTDATGDAPTAPVPAPGAADAGDGAPCTRELLASTVDAYFDALAAHDPSSLPQTDDVRFTENGEVLPLGDGLWREAGMVSYRHSALDTLLCMSVTEAVVPEAGVELPVALRLALVGSRIAEVETIVARSGDYVLFGSPFASDTDAIAASAALGWEESVAEDARAGREHIDTWLTRYFERFPNGGCDLAEDCRRLENGGGSFACSLGASCSEDSSAGGFGGPLEARLVVVDEVTGIGAGFTMFMGNTDMHMILLRAGEVHAVHAILSGADGSGWD